ncbi:MAG TPA: hypothetical protein VEF03_08620 [Candidatus Binataceae bacterium]|nr:hypothetical protein [Candidatus Binataceae bacterium]
MIRRGRINDAQTRATKMLCITFLLALAGCSAITAPTIEKRGLSDDEISSRDINEYQSEGQRQRDRASLMATLTASRPR